MTDRSWEYGALTEAGDVEPPWGYDIWVTALTVEVQPSDRSWEYGALTEAGDVEHPRGYDVWVTAVDAPTSARVELSTCDPLDGSGYARREFEWRPPVAPRSRELTHPLRVPAGWRLFVRVGRAPIFDGHGVTSAAVEPVVVTLEIAALDTGA